MTPKKSRFFTCLGCVIAGPLGCLAFLGGGTLVGIYLLPEVAEDLIERELSNGFREAFQGDLDVGSLDLSWTAVQKVDDLVLRDPEGRLVVRAEVRAPSLLDFFDESELGEIAVELDVHLVVDGQGRTNLSRAFELRPGNDADFGVHEDWEGLTRELFGRKGSIRVSLREFELVTSADAANLAPLRFSDVEASLVFGTGEPLDLSVVGSTGEGTLALEAALAREAFEPTGGGDPGLTGRFRASRVPTELVLAFHDSPERLRELFGARMDLLVELDPFAPGGAPLRAKLLSDQVELELEGTLTAAGLAGFGAATANLELEAKVRGLPPSVVALCSNGLVRIEWIGAPAPIHVAGIGLAWRRGGALELAGERFTLDLPPLALHGIGPGEPLALRGAHLVGTRAASAAWTLRCETHFGELEPSESLVVVLEGVEPLRVLARDPGVPFAFSVNGRVPLVELDRLLGLDGALANDAGPSAELHLELGLEPARPLELSLLTERARLDLEGALASSPFVPGALWGALDFEARSHGIPAAILAPILPDGVTLDWSGASEPVRITYRGWRARAGDPDPASSALSVPPNPVDLGGDLRGDLGGELRGGSVEIHASHLALGDRRLTAHGLALELVDVACSARGDDRALEVLLTARFAEGGGSLEAEGTLYGLAGPFGRAGFERAELRAHAGTAPTALLDAKLTAGGVLSTVFGPALELDLGGDRLTQDGGRFHLRASSPRAHGQLGAFHTRGAALSDAKLQLDFELDESTFARVVSPLVPLLASARFEHPGGRIALALDDGVLPIDGDPRRLAGLCRIDFAGAHVALAPEFQSFLVLAADGEVASPLSAPVVLRILGGRASVEELWLALPGGQSFAVLGDYELDGSAIDVHTELPLAVLGPNVSPILHGMSGLLRPEMSVPVVVRGRVGELSMSVRPQWIRTVGDVLGELVPDVLKDGLKKLAEDR